MEEVWDIYGVWFRGVGRHAGLKADLMSMAGGKRIACLIFRVANDESDIWFNDLEVVLDH